MKSSRQFRIAFSFAIRRQRLGNESRVEIAADNGRAEPSDPMLARGSSFRELVRELDEMVGSRTRATLHDLLSGRDVAHWDGTLSSLQFASTGEIVLGVGEVDGHEIFLSEESYTCGEVWAGGAWAVFDGIEFEIARLSAPLAEAEGQPSLYP